jgi:lysophospholipase L1-like esterase
MILIDEIAKSLNRDELYKLAFYGDSLTSADMKMPTWVDIVGYVLRQNLTGKVDDWRNKEWNLKIYNCGLDGGHTSNLLKEVDRQVLDLGPQIIFIQLGANDREYEITPEDYLMNITKLLSKIPDSIKIVLITDIYTFAKDHKGYFERVYPKIIDLADRFDHDLVDFYSELKKFDEKELKEIFTMYENGKIDLLHQNRKGHGILAEILLKDAFGIEFDSQAYFRDLDDQSRKYPRI